MNYPAAELNAERSILRTMGVAATFTTYSGETVSLVVLQDDETSKMKAGDFRSRETSHTFETIAADVPSDWRDGTLTVSGKSFNVLDVILDEYGQRAKIKAE